jgi:putative flippase GtrA
MYELIQKFIKFGLVGVTGLSVDMSLTYFFKEFIGTNKYVASSIGFAVALTTNFLLNRFWTFGIAGGGDFWLQYLKFWAVGIIGMGLTNILIYYCNERLGIKFYYSKLIAIGIVFFWNFVGNLLFTFH